MERRTFLAGTGAVLLAAPLAAEAQPGGKGTELGGKHLSLLKEALPGPKRVGILAVELGLSEASMQAKPRHATAAWIHDLRARAPVQGIQLQVVIVGEASGGELERAFTSFKSQRAQAIVVYGSTLTFAYWKVGLTIPPSLLGRADEVIQ